MAKDMDLKMRILANGAEAIRELNKVIAKIQDLNEMKGANAAWALGGRIKADLVGIGGALGKLGGVFFAPMKIAAGGVTALAAAVGALSAKSLAAAASYEKLINRISAVYGSAEKARKVFADMESLSMRSWVPTEDLVEATIVMKAFGLASEKNLGAVANAARASGQSVSEMATAISMLQMRSLKRFGIEIDQGSGGFVATWRDQMGKVQKITTKSADQMRAKLLEVMGMRFGTSLRPQGLSEFFAMFKNNLDQAFGSIGGPLLKAATHFMDYLSGKLRDLIESGKFEQLGKKIAGWYEKGLVNMQAFFDTVPDLFKALKSSGSDFLMLITEGLKSAGTILMVAIVEGITATAGVWASIGKLISGAFMEEILQLPIFAGIRNDKARQAMENMTPEEAKKIGMRPEFAGKPNFLSPDERTNWEKKREKYLWDLTPKAASTIAATGSKQTAMEGFDQLKKTLPTAMNNLLSTVSAEGRRMDGLIKGQSGYSFPEAFDAARRAREAALAAENDDSKQGLVEMALVQARRPIYQRDNAGGQKQVGWQYMDYLGDPGKVTQGQQGRYGWVVQNIVQQFIRNTDVTKARNATVVYGTRLSEAAAGA